MSSASVWRRGFAQHLAPTFATFPDVSAVLLGGSASRGWADRCFDKDMQQGVRDMGLLVEEVFTLAEMYAPNIDWSARQKRFRSKRIPVDGPL